MTKVPAKDIRQTGSRHYVPKELHMQAIVKHCSGPGNVDLADVCEPSCDDDQVKVEVGGCGICGTDLHVYHDTFPNYPPVILGHEFAGTVVEAGRRVKRFRCGDRVTVLGAMTVTCGHCAYCLKGEFMFCPKRRGMGHGVDGAFTRFVAARENQLFRLPDNLTTEIGALVEPFAAAVHAVCEISQLRLGDVVLVSGPGPIGLMCVKLLLSQGIKTIVAGATVDSHRLEIARKLGASVVVNVDEEDLLEIVKEETDGFGVDLACECAGAAGSVANCLRAVRPLGSYTQVGHFGKVITIPFDPIAFRQIRLSGSVGYTADTWRRALHILEQQHVRLDDLITHRLTLKEWREGFQLCERKQALKIVLTPIAG